MDRWIDGWMVDGEQSGLNIIKALIQATRFNGL